MSIDERIEEPAKQSGVKKEIAAAVLAAIMTILPIHQTKAEAGEVGADTKTGKGEVSVETLQNPNMRYKVDDGKVTPGTSINGFTYYNDGSIGVDLRRNENKTQPPAPSTPTPVKPATNYDERIRKDYKTTIRIAGERYDSGKFDEAESLYISVLKQYEDKKIKPADDELFDTYLHLGEINKKRGNKADAKLYFNLALSKNPNEKYLKGLIDNLK